MVIGKSGTGKTAPINFLLSQVQNFDPKSTIFFFDKNRKLSETRIIGLSPIYFDSVLNVKKELCWLYFPQLRKVLVELIDPYSGLNLDELFFERFFFGEVYKTVNRYEKMDDEEKINKLQYKDIELLLTEHQIWLFLEGLIEKY